MINTGWKCPKCEWIGDKPVSKTIKKVPFITCPRCATAVNKWVRPLTDRPGRCKSCGQAHFQTAVINHDIISKCHNCDQVYNIDKREIQTREFWENGLKKIIQRSKRIT